MLDVWVLWIFMSAPWHFGPIPMPPGWWSAAVTFSYEECAERKATMQSGGGFLSTPPILCLPADAVPPDQWPP